MADGSEQQPAVPVGRYRVRPLRKLAEGGFAQIFLVRDIFSRKEMVLKRSFIGDEESRRIVTTEVSVMKRMEHPNIVTLFDATESTSRGRPALMLLMEYCAGGTLLDRINALSSPMQEDAVWSAFRDVALAVHFMHRSDPPIAHRDIKLENILRSASGEYKLCDFGSCVSGRVSCATEAERAAEEDRIERTTTLMYRAPEMVDFFGVKAIDHGVDVWALGCILYSLAFRAHPFQNKGKLAILCLDYDIPSSSPYSDALHAAIRRMLAPQAERACAGEIATRVDAALAHVEPDLSTFPRAAAAVAAAAAGGDSDKNNSRGRRRARKAGTGLSKTDMLLQQTLGTTKPRHHASSGGGSGGGGGGGMGGGGYGQPKAMASRASAPAFAPAPAVTLGGAGGFTSSSSSSSSQPPSASISASLPPFFSQPPPHFGPSHGPDAGRAPALSHRAHSQHDSAGGDSAPTFDPFAPAAMPSRTTSAPSINSSHWAPAAAFHGQSSAPYRAAADPFGFPDTQPPAASTAGAAGAAGDPFAQPDLFGLAESAPVAAAAPAASTGDIFDPFAPACGAASAAATTTDVFDPFAPQGADPFSP